MTLLHEFGHDGIILRPAIFPHFPEKVYSKLSILFWGVNSFIVAVKHRMIEMHFISIHNAINARGKTVIKVHLNKLPEMAFSPDGGTIELFACGALSKVMEVLAKDNVFIK